MAEPTAAMGTPPPEGAARLEAVLRFAASRGISDVHLKAQQRPLYRRNGVLISRRDEALLDPEELLAIASQILPPAEKAAWQARGQVTFLLTLIGAGRFRVTMVLVRGVPTLSVRVLAPRVLSMRELNLPKVTHGWSGASQGLVLVVGPPGAGRTATWLGVLEGINTSAAVARQIVTLESPVEQLLDDKVAVIHQREIGKDVASLADGAQFLARQDADVVGLADIKPDDLALAVDLAEVRHLVVASMTGSSVVAVLQRLVESAPRDQRPLLRRRLARSLRGVVCQVLLPSADGKGLVPACEVLVPAPSVLELLRSERELEELQQIMESPHGRQYGMCGMEQALQDLVQLGMVTLDVALMRSRDPEAFRNKMAMVRSTAPVLPMGGPGLQDSQVGAHFAPLGGLPMRTPSSAALEAATLPDPFKI